MLIIEISLRAMDTWPRTANWNASPVSDCQRALRRRVRRIRSGSNIGKCDILRGVWFAGNSSLEHWSRAEIIYGLLISKHPRLVGGSSQ